MGHQHRRTGLGRVSSDEGRMETWFPHVMFEHAGGIVRWVTGCPSPGCRGEARYGERTDVWKRPESLQHLQSWVKFSTGKCR